MAGRGRIGAVLVLVGLAISLGIGPAGAQGSWSVQATPSPHIDTGALSAVACSSSDSCTAVGSQYGASPGPIVETWNGTTWTSEAAPKSTRSAQLDLAAVSCPGSACETVGSSTTSSGDQMGLAEAWNGSSWTHGTIKDPAHSSSVDLTGVSCQSASDCLAVGSYTNTTVSESRPLAYALDGSVWTNISPGLAKGWSSATLNSVSCVGPTSCTAVGSYYSETAGGALIESWNGSAWSPVTAPAPASASEVQLTSISCPSTAGCVAVGSYYDSSASVTNTLVEQGSGSAWSVVSSPNPSGAGASSLDSVSCSKLTVCEAIGSSAPDNGSASPLAEGENGTWAIQSIPTAGTNPNVEGVGCADEICEAVGQTESSSTSYDTTIADGWNGSEWSAQDSVSPSVPERDILSDVSCPSADACTALSTAGAEQYANSKWTTQKVAAPPGSSNGYVAGLSCPVVSDCEMAGYARSTGDVYTDFAEIWKGGAWTLQTMPQPPGVPQPNGVINQMSCASVSFCLAVGNYYDGGPGFQGMAEFWNGKKWALTYPPASGYLQSDLTAVSCASGSCLVSNLYDTNSGGGDEIETWSGSSWATETAPAGTLTGISCWTATGCTGISGSTAYRWDGSTWTAEALANPASGQPNYSSLSCTSASNCTVVGWTQGSEGSGTDIPLAESWDGTAWTIDTTAALPAGTSALFNGVSCTIAGPCTAVGAQSTSTSPDLPFAEGS